MTKKKIPINYYSRDFDSIKQSLVQHAKRYYPDSFKDFSEAGFGSLMLDTVSYVGDVLSFYLDYQVNESFLETAKEEQNIIKIARQLGYKQEQFVSSQGLATFFIYVPTNAVGNDLDYRYLPTLKAGSIFSATNGTQFILAEDCVFNPTSNDIVAGQLSNGNIDYYAVRGYGIVISGEYQNITVNIGDFEKFKKVILPLENITEVVSVFDSEGNEYFEVDYLTQDVVFRPVSNISNTKNYAKSLLRPFSVPRRFVVERDGEDTYLQFGQGYEEGQNIKESIIDPSKRILKLHAKNYYSENSFDPVNLVETDKFGIVPSNTILNVLVRTNTVENVNIGIDNLTQVVTSDFEFEEPENLNQDIVNFMISNLEVTNEEPILGKVTFDTNEEIKIKSKNLFATQNRAVTLEDYEALVYRMPAEFGKVKRVSVKKDLNSFKRNLNMYVLSEDENNKLIATNNIIKENLKIWISDYKMLNDVIDILDARILNIGIDFQILTDLENNKYDTLSSAKNSIINLFQIRPNIGEAIFINDIIKALKNTNGVLDVVSVNVINKTGGNYSDLSYNLEDNLSVDGRYIEIPENVIWELKFPDIDIKGVIV
jgi:hypothetical protein